MQPRSGNCRDRRGSGRGSGCSSARCSGLGRRSARADIAPPCCGRARQGRGRCRPRSRRAYARCAQSKLGGRDSRLGRGSGSAAFGSVGARAIRPSACVTGSAGTDGGRGWHGGPRQRRKRRDQASALRSGRPPRRPPPADGIIDVGHQRCGGRRRLATPGGRSMRQGPEQSTMPVADPRSPATAFSIRTTAAAASWS